MIDDKEVNPQNPFKTPFACFKVLNNNARVIGGTVGSGSDEEMNLRTNQSNRRNPDVLS